MPTQILATGSGAANSADLVVAAGDSLGVCLKGAAAGAAVNVSVKDDAGAYVWVATLTDQNPAAVLAGGFTYRLSRTGTVACGAFSG